MNLISDYLNFGYYTFNEVCGCGGVDILRVIKFVWILLDIVFLIVPIGLILMISIDFAKNVIAGREDDMRKNVSIVIKRLIFCIALFLVEPIVSFSISLLGENGVDYAKCIDMATSMESYENSLYESYSCDESNGPDSGLITPGVKDEETAGNLSDEETMYNNKLKIELNGGSTVQATFGEYNEQGIKVWRTEDAEEEITEFTSITYELEGNEYKDVNDLESAVNSITTKNQITIKYKVMYTVSNSNVLIKYAYRTVNLLNK